MAFSGFVIRLVWILAGVLFAQSSSCFLSSISPSISQLSGVTAQVTVTGSWSTSYNLYADDQLLNTSVASGKLVVTMPSQNLQTTVSIKSPSCSGALLFQYYDVSSRGVYPSTTLMRSNGGSSLTLYFTGLELIDWASATLQLTKTSEKCVGEAVTLAGSYTGNSSVFFRSNNLLNDTLCGAGYANARYSLNGLQYENSSFTVTIEQKSKYRCLFVYNDATTDFGWIYAMNLGRLAVTDAFGVSVEAVYVENVQQGSVAALETVLTENLPLDFVLLASGGYISPVYTLAKVYTDMQFITVGQDLLSSSPNASNVNILWATLHEARYLAGVVGGGVISTNGTICYIKAWDRDPEVVSGVNAFILGVHKANPHAKVQTITINTWGDADLEQEAAKFFYNTYGCELQAQHSNSFQPQEVFTTGGRYAIGSNADSRVFLGERIVTSPVFYWANVFPDVVQMGIDGNLGGKTLVYRLTDDAVGLAAESGYVSTETRDKVSVELAAIKAKNGEEFVFCGPLYDSEETLRIADGECLTNEQLGTLSWSVAGITDLGDLTLDLADHYQYLGNLQRAWCVGLGLAGICIAALYSLILYCLRGSTIIKYSQPRFLHIQLLGCMVAMSSVLLRAFNPSLLSCRLNAWTFHLGFSITFSALFVKAWRVWVIASQKSVQRVDVTDKLLLKIIFVSVVFCSLYLTLWTVIDGPVGQLTDCSTTWSSTSASYISCKLQCSSTSEWLGPLLGLEACALIYGASIALRLWQVHDVFSESRWVVLAIYNMAFQTAYIIILRNFLAEGSASLVMAICITTFLAYVVLMNVILLPKFIEVFHGRTITLQDFAARRHSIDGRPTIAASNVAQGTANKDSRKQVAHITEAGLPKSASGSGGEFSTLNVDWTPYRPSH